MMDVLYFALKALVIVVAFGSLVLLLALVIAKSKDRPELDVEPVHDNLREMKHLLQSLLLSKEDWKLEKKRRKKELKNPDTTPKKKVFVLKFDGDIKASAAESLREEVTAVLQVAKQLDEVVVCVESPGGIVHSYGFAASQLMRIRDQGLPLTICVDKVAASGGYMMACVANQILAAPFAVVGSIGVVAQVPNFHKVLKKHDVEYKEYTAGEYKRTVSLFGEITPKGEEKFLERLDDTHVLFKDFVARHRPQVDISKVSTGEYWFGTEALQMGLIDHIQTSDDYIQKKCEAGCEVYKLSLERKQKWSEKLSEIMGQSVNTALLKFSSFLEQRKISLF